MNRSTYDALVASLDFAVDVVARHRTPDSAMIAAHDTLKQARALVMQACAKQMVETEIEQEPMAA